MSVETSFLGFSWFPMLCWSPTAAEVEQLARAGSSASFDQYLFENRCHLTCFIMGWSLDVFPKRHPNQGMVVGGLWLPGSVLLAYAVLGGAIAHRIEFLSVSPFYGFWLSKLVCINASHSISDMVPRQQMRFPRTSKEWLPSLITSGGIFG